MLGEVAEAKEFILALFLEFLELGALGELLQLSRFKRGQWVLLAKGAGGCPNRYIEALK
jgi:hypothetical protein